MENLSIWPISQQEGRPWPVDNRRWWTIVNSASGCNFVQVMEMDVSHKRNKLITPARNLLPFSRSSFSQKSTKLRWRIGQNIHTPSLFDRTNEELLQRNQDKSRTLASFTFKNWPGTKRELKLQFRECRVPHVVLSQYIAFICGSGVFLIIYDGCNFFPVTVSFYLLY